MKLISDADRVLKHAWSVRFIGLAIVFQVADAVLPYFQDFLPDVTFRLLTLACAVGALGSRFIHQEKVSNEQA